jgi:hypothetical protein
MDKIHYYGLKHVRKFADGTYGSGAYAIDGIPVIWKTGEWKDVTKQMADIVSRETYELECSDMQSTWGTYDEFVASWNKLEPDWYEEDEIDFHAWGYGYIPEDEPGLVLVEVEVDVDLETYGSSKNTAGEIVASYGAPELQSQKMRIVREVPNLPEKPCYEVKEEGGSHVHRIRIPADHPESELFTWGGVRIESPLYEALTKAMLFTTAIMRS